MGKLTLLRFARWAKRSNDIAEYPNLETLIDEEAVKVTDGFHYARWIVPLVGLFFSVACFLPLAITVNPLFWIGVWGMLGLGALLGGIFHGVAKRISSTQLLLRKRCISVAQKLTSARNLLGMSHAVSPKVAETLEVAAKSYLEARPNADRDRSVNDQDDWATAAARAHRALDEAMVKLLSLAEPESPAAQEALLAEGWTEPLINEMRATSTALAKQKIAAQIAGRGGQEASLLSDLADARGHLERMERAVQELEDGLQEERA